MTVFRDNREPDPGPQDAAQIAASANPETKVAPAGVVPSVSNEQWLADSINELKTKDADYLRLQSETARAEWENATRDNLRRQRAIESNQADIADLHLAQRDATDAKHNSELFKYAEELANRLRIEFPNGYTAQSLPNETLRDIIRTNQLFQQAAELAGAESATDGVIPVEWNPKDSHVPQAEPRGSKGETFPDGQLYQLTENPDGSVEVKLATGERFVGSPVEVTRKIAEAKVHTTRWAHDLKSKLNQPNGTITPPENGNGEVSEFGIWAANEQARALGFSNREEMLAWGQKVNQTVTRTDQFIETQQLRAVTADFMARCPDFPGTPKAISALSAMVAQNGWDATPDNMEAAHAHLVRTKAYTPLSLTEQNETWANRMQADNWRTPPPPMIRSDSPDASNRTLDLYTEPLEQQRQRIIREQLAAKGL